MKYLALILLIGLTSAAYVHDDLLDDYYEDLIISQKNFVSFAEAEQDMKTELGKHLKKTLDRILSEIKDTLDRGKSVSRELIDQARDTLVKLKDFKVELEGRTKDLLQDVKDRLKSWWKEVLDKLNVHKDDNKVQHSPMDLFRKLVERFGLEKHIQVLQEMMTGNTDMETIHNFMKEKFPRTKVLVDKMMEILASGREKFQDFLAKLLKREN
ncbi:uncharacterized protein LOC111642053 [Centruroides sculpturatus]|uniref:uncharacterized protein LOC111642053 n=1 Tax=Centruroides sculpturatus TaxID=218467 RepID=UPI000C6EAE12|nr:uncharacterized protein LOC111642053 [Centruroides sculpturatus]